MLLNYHIVLFLDCCVLELGCGSARVLSGPPTEAQLQSAAQLFQVAPSIHFFQLMFIFCRSQ